jgi:hypothetical protein
MFFLVSLLLPLPLTPSPSHSPSSTPTPSHSSSLIFIFQFFLMHCLFPSLFLFFIQPLRLSLLLPLPWVRTDPLMWVCVHADPQTRACVCADPRTLHGRGCASAPISGRRPTHIRVYITPVHVHYFCSFSPLPLVEVVGFAWQRPFRLAKGEGAISILKGIPLHFLQSKNLRVVFTLLMLVYSVLQVFM